jgi:hypothetical protein
MKEVVEFDIIPLLNEYWSNDIAKCNLWEKNLMDVFVEK